MSEVSHLELRVTSDGVVVADKRLQGLTTSGAKAEKTTDALSAGAKRLVGPLLAVGGAAAAAHKVMGETIAYENLIARLSGVAGGAVEAAAAFETLEKLSDKTIFTENQMAEAFLYLEQTGLDGSERALKAFANIASATGQSMGNLAEMTLSASMGIFRSMQSMGIRAVADGNKVRLTFKGVTTTIGNSAREIQEYLVRIGETDFAGAAERQLDTMGGAVKELGDAWGDLFREIGRSAIGDAIKTSIGAAATVVGGVTTVVEGLLYTISKKADELNAKQRKNLQNFISQAATMPRADDDTDVVGDREKELRYLKERGLYITEQQIAAARAADAEGRQSWGTGATQEGKDAQTKLEEIFKATDEAVNKSNHRLQKYIEDRQHILEMSANPEFEFDSRQALADLDAAYAAEAGGGDAPQAGPKKEIESLEDWEYRVKLLTKKAIEERDALMDKEAQDTAQKRYDLEESLRQMDERFREEERREMQENAQMREALFDGLLTEEEELRKSYERRLADIEEYNARDIGFARESVALKARLQEDYEQKMLQLEMGRVGQATQNAEALFGSLAEVAKNSGGEQSAGYRAMFATQKAFAVASATVAGGQAMAEAMKLGWPAGIPAGIAAMAQIAKAMAMISSANYSGAYDSGGFIPAGRWGIAGERGPEVVQGPAHVTSRADTAKMLGGQSIKIVTAPDPAAAEQYMHSAAGERLIMAVVRRNSATIRRM